MRNKGPVLGQLERLDYSLINLNMKIRQQSSYQDIIETITKIKEQMDDIKTLINNETDGIQ
jgi:hypothetical protein